VILKLKHKKNYYWATLWTSTFNITNTERENLPYASMQFANGKLVAESRINGAIAKSKIDFNLSFGC
jgi:hypothetical protein